MFHDLIIKFKHNKENKCLKLKGVKKKKESVVKLRIEILNKSNIFFYKHMTSCQL